MTTIQTRPTARDTHPAPSPDDRRTAAPAPSLLGLAQLASLTRSIARRRALWLPQVRFDEGTRWWTRLEGPPGTDVWLLSWLTSRAVRMTVADSQCGYTAITRRACARLDLTGLWPRFGYPNDLLGMLAARELSIQEVPVRPVYADEESGIRAFHVLSILGIIARRSWIERTRS